jgi:POLQ-like helicase
MIPFADELNFLVEEYAGVKGNLPPIKRQSKPTLYICTIEKAHSLVNSLIETDRLRKEIGIVVADELHMIGDGSRGAIYEMILSKVKYCSKLTIESNLKLIKGANPASSTKSYLNQPIQIVATTATLQNKSELAKFLDAFMYERDFRPVELKEYIKVGTQVFEVDKANINKYDEDSEGFVKPVRNLDLRSYTNQMKTADPDGLIALVSLVFFY